MLGEATEESDRFLVIGQVNGLPKNTSYTLTLIRVDSTQRDVVTDSQFPYQLARGHYRINLVVAYNLPVILEFDVRDTDIQLPTIHLMEVDFDGNGNIDHQDANLLIHYYGYAGQDAPSQMDLNGDSLINLLDLNSRQIFQVP